MPFTQCGLGTAMCAFLALQGQEITFTHAMIKKLGSNNFTERAVADAWLRKNASCAPLLEKARESADLETKRRITDLLDFHARRDIEELSTLVGKGTVNEVIDRLSKWPIGKQEEGVRREIHRLTKTLCSLSSEKHDKFNLSVFNDSFVEWPHDVITDRAVVHLVCLKYSFVRGNRISVPAPKSPFEPARPLGVPGEAPARASIVASGAVEIHALDSQSPNALRSGAIFTRGSVTIHGSNGQLVIVSDADVTFSSLSNSIIIARGKVTCKSAARCHIISGESLAPIAKRLTDCVISENDANPLGFIRWSEPAKEKMPFDTK